MAATLLQVLSRSKSESEPRSRKSEKHKRARRDDPAQNRVDHDHGDLVAARSSGGGMRRSPRLNAPAGVGHNGITKSGDCPCGWEDGGW
jgi:hypothetical protein